jgi:hypothetical protein
MPFILWRVVWGTAETMLIFALSKALSMVDLPALGRPIIATKPDLKFSPIIFGF